MFDPTPSTLRRLGAIGFTLLLAPSGLSPIGPTPAAAQGGTGPNRFLDLFYRSLYSRSQLERTVGKGRTREIRELRYRMHRYESTWPHWAVGHDHRELLWMRKAAVNNLGKVLRESILQSGAIGRLHRRVEREADQFAAEHSPASIDLDAKIDLGHKRHLGFEIGMPSNWRPLHWSPRTALRFQARHGLDTDRHLLRFRWLTPNGEFVLDNKFGRGWDREEISFVYRYQF